MHRSSITVSQPTTDRIHTVAVSFLIPDLFGCKACLFHRHRVPMLISTKQWLGSTSMVTRTNSSFSLSHHHLHSLRSQELMKLSSQRTTSIAIAAVAFSISSPFHPTAKAFALSRRFLLLGGTSPTSRHSFSSSSINSVSKSSSSSSSLEMSKKVIFPTWSFDSACDTMQVTSMANVTLSISRTSKSTAASSSSTAAADLIIVGIYGPPPKKEEEERDATQTAEDTPVPEPLFEEYVQTLNTQMGGAIRDLMIENYKSFQHGSKAGVMLPTLRVVQPSSSSSVTRLVLVGLGSSPTSSSEEVDTKTWKDIEPTIRTKIGSAIASKCDSESKTKTCMMHVPTSFVTTNHTSTLQVSSSALSDLTSEFYTSLYSDNRYRSGDKIKKIAQDLTHVTIQLIDDTDIIIPTPEDTFTSAVAQGKAISWGQYLTKDIVNAPHNVLNSMSLANVARMIAQESQGRLICTILGKKECEERGMGAYLGVARGR